MSRVVFICLLFIIHMSGFKSLNGQVSESIQSYLPPVKVIVIAGLSSQPINKVSHMTSNASLSSSPISKSSSSIIFPILICQVVLLTFQIVYQVVGN